jgi:hypothetical protein
MRGNQASKRTTRRGSKKQEARYEEGRNEDVEMMAENANCNIRKYKNKGIA